METFKITAVLLLMLNVFISCDEKFDFTEGNQRSIEENLMTNSWVYQNIFVDSDTIVIAGSDTVSTGYLKFFNWRGEPIVATERSADIRRTYLKYGLDHSYELFTDGDFGNLGFNEENYQPNYGYWDIEKSGDSTILIHNKLLDYQKRYEIITLTKDTLVRRLIGPRVVYHYTESSASYVKFTAHTWIETFVKR